MVFVDYARLFVKSGNGGSGCVSFRREKYIPRGGPDGGDGGKGGSVIFRATTRLNTLLAQRYKKIYKAKNGEHGKGRNMHGKDGADTIIEVPAGTVIKDAESEEMLFDLHSEGAECTVVRGGRGGKGNAHFKGPVRQTPRFAQDGEPGEEANIIIELKLIADVGLAGLPNAGKSTFIASVSAAKPKIGEYPFTTLTPNLGVVTLSDYRSFTIVDIPGIIENAHKGAGLGLTFLRHAERTRLLLHLIDISGFERVDTINACETINNELAKYSRELAGKPQIIVGTKLDIADDATHIESLGDYCAQKGLPFFSVSSVTGDGVKELINYIYKRLYD